MGQNVFGLLEPVTVSCLIRFGEPFIRILGNCFVDAFPGVFDAVNRVGESHVYSIHSANPVPINIAHTARRIACRISSCVPLGLHFGQASKMVQKSV